jgi:hypothetical protein
MIKSQDVVLLLKLLSNPDHLKWPQARLAMVLCVSVSEINAGLKRLIAAGLLQRALPSDVTALPERAHPKASRSTSYQPVLSACEEFLISGVKYFYPVKLGAFTAGIETSYAAPILRPHIMLGSDPLPVWPYAEGTTRGLSFKPLYPSVPKSIALFPDAKFYDLLCLIDVLRQARVREHAIAITLLKESINLCYTQAGDQ